MTRERGYCVEVPVAFVALWVGWIVSSVCIIGGVFDYGDPDGPLKPIGFFFAAMAMTGTIVNSQAKTRRLLKAAYNLGREEGRAEVVQMSGR